MGSTSYWGAYEYVLREKYESAKSECVRQGSAAS